MKICKKCGTEKPETDYYAHPEGKNGLNPRCKPCVQSVNRVWAANNRERVNASHRAANKRNPEAAKARMDRYRASHKREVLNVWLKHRFGISVDMYESLLSAQNGVCAICLGSDKYGRRLSVDHDHATGRVRGLLCTDCNVSLGKFHDDVVMLRRAVSYLEKSGVVFDRNDAKPNQ